MKTIGFILLLTASAAFCRLRAEAPDPDWHTDFAAARKTAAREKRRMYVLFVGSDHCPYSMRFEKDVLTRPKFAKFIRTNNLVLVYIDFPRRKKLPPEEQKANQALAARWGVEIFPTGLVFDENGKRLGSIAGVTSLDNYIDKLDTILKKASPK